MDEKEKKPKEKYRATCRINGASPDEPPLALPGAAVSFGNRKGQIPEEHKESFLKSGQVVPE